MNNDLNTKTQTHQPIYSRIHRFAELTKKLIKLGNIPRAKKCFKVAEQILKTGSSLEKNAITNVFVFSVSSFMEMHHCNIRQLFPESLQTEYVKQINASCA